MSGRQLVIGAIVAAVLVYPLVMGALAGLAQPSRLKMARLGERILANPSSERRHRTLVLNLLEDAFDWRSAVALAVACPFFFLGRGFGWISEDDYPVPGGSLGTDLIEFTSLHTRSIAASNPVFFVILFLELLVFGSISLLLSLFRGGCRSLMKEIFNADAVFELSAYASVKSRHDQSHSPA